MELQIFMLNEIKILVNPLSISYDYITITVQIQHDKRAVSAHYG